MTRFALTAAAAALATAGTAFAYTGVSPTMVQNVESIIAESGLDVDVTTLTDEQIVEIYATTQGGSDGDQADRIKAALDGEGYGADITTRRVILTTDADIDGLMPVGENSVVASVQNFLDAEGFSVDASTLTDAQVAELYFLGFSGDDQTPRGEIETILNM